MERPRRNYTPLRSETSLPVCGKLAYKKLAWPHMSLRIDCSVEISGGAGPMTHGCFRLIPSDSALSHASRHQE
ncbi:hypothetical protein J1614_000464 [Plenodomus biglobosus]|nr:hypothetical protein J1614_000464 [Plenodomus biglobosus]